MTSAVKERLARCLERAVIDARNGDTAAEASACRDLLAAETATDTAPPAPPAPAPEA